MRLTPTLCLLALAAPAVAQHGHLGGVAASMSFDTTTAVRHNEPVNTLRMRSGGIRDVYPPSHPPHTLYLVPGQTPWSGVTGLEIDAFSSGINLITATAAGVADPTIANPQNWAGMSFSISRSTEGITGSFIRAHKSSSALFQYIYPGSYGVAASLVGRVRIAVDEGNIELNAPGTGQLANDQIGHDLTIPVAHGEPSLIGPLPQSVQTILFSVSNATAHLIPLGWTTDATNQTHPDLQAGSTVFVSGRGATGWSTPRVFLTSTDLGIGIDRDTEALAWDEGQNYLLFGTTDPSQYAIMFKNLSTGAVSTFKQTNGQPVATAIGMRPPSGNQKPDRVTAICSFDPHVPGWTTHVGTPPTFDGTTFAAVYRTYPAGGPSNGRLVTNAMPNASVVWSTLPWAQAIVSRDGGPWQALSPWMSTAPLAAGTALQHEWTPLTGASVIDVGWIFHRPGGAQGFTDSTRISNQPIPPPGS